MKSRKAAIIFILVTVTLDILAMGLIIPVLPKLILDFLGGEMTDAAMAARAECVMLNKGPYLLEAIDELDTLLGRMEGNQHKKTPQLRRLRSW